MKIAFFGGDFEATFDPNQLPGDVRVKVRVVARDEESEVLWQPRYNYVHGLDSHFTGLFREIIKEALEKSVATTSEPTEDSKNVILRGIREGNRFFTSYSKTRGDQPTKLLDGTIAYQVLGYTETSEAAQLYLFGRVYPV